MKTVLVTGGAGFIAVHCMIKLLNDGYRVRATLRSLTREAEVRVMLKEGGMEAGDRLSVIGADLTADKHWNEDVKDCTNAAVKGRIFVSCKEESTIAGNSGYNPTSYLTNDKI